jgi:hypothetical protein
MFNWTNPYTPPEKAGVTAGTINVPTFVPSDWRLTKRDAASGNRYICSNTETGGYAELDINQTNVANIYGNSNVAANEQLSLLSGRSAYVRLRLFGPAADETCDCMSGLAPVSVSMNVTLPTGVTITDGNIQDIVGVVCSVFSEAITSGTVVPMSDAVEMSLGAINK